MKALNTHQQLSASRAIFVLFLLTFVSHSNRVIGEKSQPSFCGVQLGSKLINLKDINGIEVFDNKDNSDFRLSKLNIDDSLLPFPIKSVKVYSTLVTGLIFKIEVVIYNNLSGGGDDWVKSRFVSVANSLKENYKARFKNDGGQETIDLFPEAILLKNDFKISLAVANIFGFVTNNREINLEYLSLSLLDKAQKEAKKPNRIKKEFIQKSVNF